MQCPSCGFDTDSPRLTASDLEVAELIGRGYPDVLVAEELGIELTTVKGRATRLYRKLGISRYKHQRVRLAMWWNCELFQIGLKELGIL